MYKIDLHTHSIISNDGSLSEHDYQTILEQGILDCVAITDHNQTRFAQSMQKKLGDKIIVGEEIATSEGEMIGLFLTSTVPAGLTAKQTAAAIHEQGGLVLIPHPFETVRKGMQRGVLETIADEIDLFEVFNGRGRWRGKAQEAQTFADRYDIAGVSNSDAHGIWGIGKTFSCISQMPTKKSLTRLIKEGTIEKVYAPLRSYLYPTVNVIKNSALLLQREK